MKSNITHKISLISLIIISIICGVFWRVEIEYHGWGGLKWLSYFQLAIPFSFILLMIWFNLNVKLSIIKRSVFNFVSLIYVFLMYILISSSLHYPYSKMLAFTSEFSFVLYRLAYILIPLVTTGAFLILKLFKIKSNWKKLLYSTALFLLAIPLSIFILKIINHIGSADFIHAIKSGIIIPFWVFSIGILILRKPTP
jgi:hypothetical protein